MPNHGAARQGLTSAIAAEVRHWRGSRARRRDERDGLTFTQLDARRIDDRIDTLVELLAQLSDYSGQYDAADDFRALSYRWEPIPGLRLVEGQ